MSDVTVMTMFNKIWMLLTLSIISNDKYVYHHLTLYIQFFLNFMEVFVI